MSKSHEKDFNPVVNCPKCTKIVSKDLDFGEHIKECKTCPHCKCRFPIEGGIKKWLKIGKILILILLLVAGIWAITGVTEPLMVQVPE